MQPAWPKHLALFSVLALALAACNGDQPLGPTEQAPFSPVDVKPMLNHAPPGVPGVAVDVNNYELFLDGELFVSGVYKGFPVLFAGGLAYGNAPDAAFLYNTRGTRGPGFVSPLPIEVSAGPVADHQTVVLLLETTDDNIGPSTSIGLAVVRETFAFTSAPDDDYVMVKYTLTNTTPGPVTGLHLGEVLDIDAGFDPSDDVVEFVGADQSAQTTGFDVPVFHGHILLSDPVTSYQGFCNPSASCPNPDPATLTEWFSFLTGGIIGPGPLGQFDTRELLTTGPVNIPAGGSLVLFTALLGGDDAADLSANVAAARAKYASLPAAATDPYPPLLAVDMNLGKIKPKKNFLPVTLSFPNPQTAAQFEETQTFCGGVQATNAKRKGRVVSAEFPKADLDPRLRDGDEIACGGILADGTLFADRVVLRVVDQPIAPVTQLTSVGQNHGPTWSPDGNSIAFVSDRVGGSSIWSMNIAAGEASALQLTSGGAGFISERLPDWSPDGTTIAFSRDGEILTVPAAGGAETQLTTGSPGVNNNPSWSPDGTQIVFRRGSHIWLMSAAGEIGGPAIPIATDGNIDFQPYWAADGLVYFSSQRAPVFDIGVFRVDPLAPEPSTPADLVTPVEGTSNRHPAVSPDGQTMAFISASTAGREIILQHLGTGEHTIVLLDTPVGLDFDNRTASIEFSPDGSQIVFAGSDRQVYVVDVSGLL